MKRRLIPPLFALGVFALALLPIWTDWLGEPTADRWTLLLVTTVFGFLALLFGWMRRRMTTDDRRLTVFGTALVDFFTSLVILAAIMSYVFGIAYVYAKRGELTPGDLRTINRALLAAAGSLVIATGVATAWEMRRAGAHLDVHESPEDDKVLYEGPDRRTGLPDRRTTDR